MYKINGIPFDNKKYPYHGNLMELGGHGTEAGVSFSVKYYFNLVLEFMDIINDSLNRERLGGNKGIHKLSDDSLHLSKKQVFF